MDDVAYTAYHTFTAVNTCVNRLRTHPLSHASIDAGSDTQCQIGSSLISKACSEVMIGSVGWSCSDLGTDLIDFLSVSCSVGVSDSSQSLVE